MKKILILIALSALFIMPSVAKTKIEVLKVYDGDSILAKINNNIFRIRLIDIDCFEGTASQRAQMQAKKHNLSTEEIVKGGNIAKEILKNELDNKEVYFEFQGIDKYKRALGYLYADDVNINQKMEKTPYCETYMPKMR